MPRYDSLLDPQGNLFIDENNWVVAILRKPNGSNPEHAFLMVEGVTAHGTIHLARYDLFIDNTNKANYTIKDKIKVVASNQAKQTFLVDLLNNDDITGQCWSISKQQAKQLHENILDSQQNPGKYNMLGDVASLPKTADGSRAISPGSAEVTSEKLVEGIQQLGGKKVGSIAQQALSPSGHSCFTWARAMLYSLQDQRIQRELPKKAEELLASVTSRHIDPPEVGTGPKEGCRIS